MRALLVLVCACAPRVSAAPLAATATTTIDAYVLDAHGPVANAEVRLLPLRDRACPCTPEDAKHASPMNALPDCQCAAALAMWRDEIQHCNATAVSSARTDAHGHVVVPIIGGGTTLVAATPTGERWVRTPQMQTTIALELAPTLTPRFTVTNADADLRGALVFDDGHCTPLVRDHGAFVTAHPVPAGDATFVITNRTSAAVARWSGEATKEIEYTPAMHLTETCDPNDAVTLWSPFQHSITRANTAGVFHFNDVLGFEAEVTCGNGDPFAYLPGNPFGRTMVGGITSFDGACFPVDVVDGRGRPVAEASISAMHSLGGNASSGSTVGTDAQGRACVDEEAEMLTVAAPATLGGQCSASDDHKLTRRPSPSQTQRPVRITIRPKKLRAAGFTGRVINPEHLPVADALVRLESIEPTDTPGCDTRVEFDVHTRADGTFTLPAYPIGKAELSVDHAWYRPSTHSVQIGGPPRDLVVDRGASWTGRVLDPEGHVVTACEVFVEKKSESYIKSAKCSAAPFTFGALPPGDFEVHVWFDGGVLGQRRMPRTIHIAANTAHTLDLQLPAGEAISGDVIDAAGAPIPGGRITAFPKGGPRLSDRWSDGEVQVLADGTGHFELRHLAPGTWQIHGNSKTLQGHEIEVVTSASNVHLVIAK